MRKLVYSPMVSLDGYIAGPHGELDWSIVDEELHRFVNNLEYSTGLYLNGRRTYQLLAEFWPTADENPSNPDYVIEFAKIWKEMPKIVYSKTLEQVEWNSRLAREVDAGEIARLKAQPGKDIELGGANLAATFIRNNWVDEYRIYVNPVLLGGGHPLFPAMDQRINLQLVETHRFASGVIFSRYQAIK